MIPRMNRNEWLSRQEAAVVLSVDLPEIDRYISLGLLDRYRLRGRYVRVLRAQVDELATVAPELRRIA